VQLEAATEDDFLDWRDRLVPGRLPRTVNRLVRAVVAGLNKAHTLGHTGKPTAWQIGALSDDSEDETAVFLSSDQRKYLIRAASPEAADFLRALGLSGARPHEIAQATVAAFDGANLKLSHRKGRPPKLRTRHVVPDQDGVEFFTHRTHGRAPDDLIFTATDARPWRRDLWQIRFARPSRLTTRQRPGTPDFLPMLQRTVFAMLESASCYSFTQWTR
jgi:hypothetical protein